MENPLSHEADDNRIKVATSYHCPKMSVNQNSYTPLGTPTPLEFHDWPDNSVPLVTVICTAFNHGDFIRKCLDGFMMQETDFPVEILIHDDASKDATAAIIGEYQEMYPSIIRSILQTENQFSKGMKILPLLIEMAHGPYVAICEGDDYWTDPRKLAKQVTLMTSNPTFSLCGTIVRCVKSGKDQSEVELPEMMRPWHSLTVLGIEDFVGGYPIHTSTAMFRRHLLNIPNIFDKVLNLDVCMFAMLAARGPVGFIHECTSTYRIHEGGIYSGKNQLQRLKSFQNTCNLLNGYFEGKYIERLRRWEYKDARILWRAAWNNGKHLNSILLYLELFPRYARHVTVIPWIKCHVATIESSIAESWERCRMRVGLRTRIRRMLSR